MLLRNALKIFSVYDARMRQTLSLYAAYMIIFLSTVGAVTHHHDGQELDGLPPICFNAAHPNLSFTHLSSKHVLPLDVLPCPFCHWISSLVSTPLSIAEIKHYPVLMPLIRHEESLHYYINPVLHFASRGPPYSTSS